MSRWSLRELAERVQGRVIGDPEMTVTGAARWQEGGSDHLAIVYTRSELEAAEASAIGALLVPADLAPCCKPAISTPRPRLAWAQILTLFALPEHWCPEIHPTAVLGEGVSIAAGVGIGAYTVIGPDTRIAEGTRIGAHCVLGAEVIIGRECRLYSQVTLYDRVELGDRVILHSGVVVGADGFGFERTDEGFVKIPQIGRVVIEADVEVGANATIDRATVGESRIGAGTKIDNLVQIGHNVRVGRNSIIVAQVGIGGSTVVEDNVMIGGQAGITDHVRIGRGARIGAQSGVIHDIPPGTDWFGCPAQPRTESLRSQILLRQLPDLKRRLQELERRLKDLQADSFGNDTG